MRVLLVEDNDGDAELIADALRVRPARDEPLELQRVDRVSRATEQLESERYDLVLLDLSLPDATGFEALHRLRKASPGVPIVVLTGMTDANAGVRAIRDGAQDYLQKADLGGLELFRSIRYGVERAQYAERTRLLSDVGAALGKLREPQEVTSLLPVLVAARFAEWCELAGAAEAGAGESWQPDASSAESPPGLLVTTLSAQGAGGMTQARAAELMARGVRSAIVVPFRAAGWPQGEVFFGRGERSAPYGPADLSLAEELTRRMAAAIDYTSLLALARRETARAEIAARARDEFLATLSHELRTPLNAILGWTVMLRGGQVAPEKHQRAFETIERNARSQVALIEDVLEVSRIITGKIRLAVSTVNLREVLDSALETVKPAAEAKDVLVETLCETEDTELRADPDRLLQILWNLLSNAVKFTPRGGRVSVLLRRDEGALEIQVCDTGQGIDAALLPHIFERFKQGDSAITRHHGGLGLGLAIARHLSELLGGTLRAESAGVGAGATFLLRLASVPMRVSLPGEAATALAVPLAAAPALMSLEGLEVLVVDDDEDARGLLQEMLETGGVVVRAAESVEQALRALHAKVPDVLISDIGMPGASGYELIETLRARTPAQGGTIPAIALTAYARTEDRERALKLGFDQHVSKPVERETLLGVVAQVLRARSERSSRK